MKTTMLLTLVGVGTLAGVSGLWSQPPMFSPHYPNGVEGIKGATLPPPGIYFRDYNYFYTSRDFPGGPGEFEVQAYVQAPRLIWISSFEVLGGYYGADVLVPLVYQNVKVFGDRRDHFGLGDVFVEPITLSWHKEQYDLGIGYGFWAPSGDWDPGEVNPGKGYWGHMLTAGATVYLDPPKSWSVSVLNRYEINQENSDTEITPGQAWTMEWGISRTFNQTLDVGVVGYHQVQTTRERGPGASRELAWVYGVGPEVNLFVPKLMFFASARYVYEIDAGHRPQGHMVNVTLTKRF
jgi:hypothetical protein